MALDCIKNMMMNKRLEFLCFVLVTFGFFSYSRADCTIAEYTDDQLVREEEKKLLKAIEPLKGAVFEAENGNYTYKLRICESLEGVKDGTGALQINKMTKTSVMLGKVSSADIYGGGGWINLVYRNGSNYASHCGSDNRTTMIMIMCDPSKEKGDFKMLTEKRRSDSANCFYLFELRSQAACSGSSGGMDDSETGLSSGSVFCIIFFTFFGLYIVLGFLYKRLVVGAQGLEQIPNYGFWREFGNLQADACDFVCRCGPRQESHAYRSINDRVKDERDEQLLN